MSMHSKALQRGELLLITGGTGWVGSHIVDKALGHGLHVRLAIRDHGKASSLIEGMKKKYGASVPVEVMVVRDFGVEGAYNDAVKGVQGINHTASNLSYIDRWDDVIPPTIQSYRSLLTAAHAEGDSVKRVVITSSSIAALGMPNLKKDGPAQYLDITSWNMESVEEAKTTPNLINVYAASKVLSEKFAWDFVKENDPAFTVNVVCPNVVAGARTMGLDFSSSGATLRNVIFEGSEIMMNMLTSQYIVDAEDVALLHILAATRADIAGERLLAFSETFTWDQLIGLARKHCPERVNPPKKTATSGLKDNTIVDTRRTRELQEPFGGFKSLDEIVRLSVQDEYRQN